MKIIKLQAMYAKGNVVHTFCFGVRRFRYTEGETYIHCYCDGISDNEITVPENCPMNMICEYVEKFVAAEIKRTYNLT